MDNNELLMNKGQLKNIAGQNNMEKKKIRPNYKKLYNGN